MPYHSLTLPNNIIIVFSVLLEILNLNFHFAMIKPEDRFFTNGQWCLGRDGDPQAETKCNVYDWDQLRMVTVKGTAKVLPQGEDKEIPILAQFANYLSLEVHSVTVDDDGLLSGVSTDLQEDSAPFAAYLPFSTVPSLASCRTIWSSQLEELDRFGPGVDLSSYKDESGNPQHVAFKFCPLALPVRIWMFWLELHILKSIPPHPNLVLLDRVVLENVQSRIIGLTTKYIPGGTLENPKVPFRFEWLQQLTQVVDFLNLEMGIMHQDIAPRNLLIDPDTHELLLFDFNFAACGKQGLEDGCDDVTGTVLTLYELITNDTHFTSIPHWDRNMDLVQSISEWPRNRELDADVSTFRNFLDGWVATRKSDGDMERYLNAPHKITCPDLPTPPDYDVPFQLGTYANGEPYYRTGPRLRRTAVELGQYCYRWERPPQRRLLKMAENGG